MPVPHHMQACQATFDEKNIGISVFKYRRNKGEIYHTHTCYMKTLFTDILMNEYLIITVTDKSWPPPPLIANPSSSHFN